MEEFLTPWTIAVGLGYFPGLLIVFRLMAVLQRKLWVDRVAERSPRTKAAQASIPKPIWVKWSERLSFTVRDGRPLKGGSGPSNRAVFFLLFLAGWTISVWGAYSGSWKLVLFGYFLFFFTMTFGIMRSKDVVETRKNVIRKMYEIGASKGVVSTEYADNPSAIINVLEWSEYVKPQKVEYQVRTEFSAAGEEGFLQQFNQIFGAETAWVPSDNEETGEPGWNYDAGKVTLHAVPPLPRMAEWSERYVLDPAIAWSFFPIALGVEHGVELSNPETGETEYVLGFDLSGEQAKVGSKAGVKVAEAITTSPMVFIGGGTGGGKALAADTLVRVVNPPLPLTEE